MRPQIRNEISLARPEIPWILLRASPPVDSLSDEAGEVYRLAGAEGVTGELDTVP